MLHICQERGFGEGIGVYGMSYFLRLRGVLGVEWSHMLESKPCNALCDRKFSDFVGEICVLGLVIIIYIINFLYVHHWIICKHSHFLIKSESRIMFWSVGTYICSISLVRRLLSRCNQRVVMFVVIFRKIWHFRTSWCLIRVDKCSL